jgi:hypothetical protein
MRSTVAAAMADTVLNACIDPVIGSRLEMVHPEHDYTTLLLSVLSLSVLSQRGRQRGQITGPRSPG